MDKKRMMQALDDADLESVIGGAGDAPKLVPLSSLSAMELQYYIQMMCPKCKDGLKSYGGYAWLCERCNTLYTE